MALGAIAAPLARTVADQVSSLLAALYDGLAPRGRAWAVVDRGTAATTFSWAPYAPHDIWPPPLLRELRYDVPPDVMLCPSTLDDQGIRLRDTRCVWTELQLAPVLDPVRGWVVTQESESAASERLESFPLPPSIVNDQGWSLWVAWLLEGPVALDSAATLRRVMAVQRALAERLGGIAEDVTSAASGGQPTAPGEAIPLVSVAGWHPARRALRVPASRNHDRGAKGARVRLVRLDEQVTYPLEEIERVLGGGAAERGKR